MEHDEDMRAVTFEEYDLVDPLQPRDAFYGGTYQRGKVITRVSGRREDQVRIQCL